MEKDDCLTTALASTSMESAPEKPLSPSINRSSAVPPGLVLALRKPPL